MSEKQKRKEIWNEAFKIYYTLFFQENLSGEICQRWTWVVRVLNTTTLMVLSFVFLSSHFNFSKTLIGIVSIVGIIVSIIQFFPISEKAYEWNTMNTKLREYRVKMEALRSDIKQEPNFSLKAFIKRFEQCRYMLLVKNQQMFTTSIFNTNSLKNKVQDKLDYFLKDEIESG